MNQCEKIVRYINKFGSITTMQAFQDLGITRLASRIHDLENNGYMFEREIVKARNRYDDPVHYMKYSFKEGK